MFLQVLMFLQLRGRSVGAHVLVAAHVPVADGDSVDVAWRMSVDVLVDVQLVPARVGMLPDASACFLVMPLCQLLMSSSLCILMHSAPDLLLRAIGVQFPLYNVCLRLSDMNFEFNFSVILSQPFQCCQVLSVVLIGFLVFYLHCNLCQTYSVICPNLQCNISIVV